MTESFDRHADRPVLTRVLPILAVVAGLGAGMYFLVFRTPEPPLSPPLEAPAPSARPATTTDVTPAAPAVDEGATAATDSTRIPQAPIRQDTLPSLADSDAEVRGHLRALFGDGPLVKWLGQNSLLQRISVLIAGLARGEFSLETLMLEPPAGGFQVDVRDGQRFVSPRNYARYNAMVGLVDGLDVTALAESFRRYRPLLEAAHGELGQPPEQLDTALLGAIDHLLGTPEPVEPPLLAHESVAYTYADPELEGLSPARKQLLRMGPAHTRTLKAKLVTLRAALLATPPTDPAAAPYPSGGD